MMYCKYVPLMCFTAGAHSNSLHRSGAVLIARLAVLMLLGVVPAFCQDSQPLKSGPSAQSRRDACANFDWRAQLQADQDYILSKLPLRVDDLEKAVAPGGVLENYELAHLYTILLGNGATLTLKDDTQIGRPDFLVFYAGNFQATVADAVKADLPKNPYTLAGWTYLALYDYDNPEQPRQTAYGYARCMPKQDWFIHEAGWHLSDGGFLPTPGARTQPPQDPNDFFWHPRLWDMHVWVNLCGEPIVGFLDQHLDGRLVSGAGYAVPTGSFFYPPLAPSERTPIRWWKQIHGPFCSPDDI